MGKKQDGKSVVGPDFRVFGLSGLRIADLSITPILPNCHTQSTGYAIGIACAEKLIDEYDLDKLSRSFEAKSRL
jgi:choline dehydrogenase-like flavoprotein